MPKIATPLTTTYCKNSLVVRVEDFVFSGIKFPQTTYNKTGIAALTVTPTLVPSLNSLGMSFVRADLDIGGVNVPHFHPRATEPAFVLEGRIYWCFVDSHNNVFAKVIEKGEVMVSPKGLVHFQMNVGDSLATILGSFKGQNPGLRRIPNVVFGTDIKIVLLEKAFGLSGKDIGKIRK